MTFDGNGNATAWSGVLTEYDILGRVKRSTVPTEIDSNWNLAGDDSAWLWKEQEYDWKGRVTREINTDGITDRLYSYEGCGCAGGQVTTIQSESVPRNDVTGNARRTQKLYEDILGRAYKTELLNWDNSVYSTIKTTFNGRDQAIEVKQYQGTDTSSTFQTTTATFDGHGRLKTQHRPEQNSNTYTTYNYNADDSISSLIDARGAVTNYGYNNRRLVEGISYSVPQGSNIPVPSNVTFAYDSAGNRTQTNDGLGNVVYEYNELSQMISETRQFNDTLQEAPLSNNRYKLEYTYSLSGHIKSYKDPFGEQINYAHDKIGRLNSVTGSTFGGVTNYASNPQYRAWGALKHLEYGNGAKFDITNFNNKLQATNYEVKDSSNTSIIKKQYQFYDDGGLKYFQDELNAKFDRSYKYDHLSRMVEAKTGAEARGQTDSAANIPYSQNFTYDVFGNTMQTQAKNYSAPLRTVNMTFQNNRRTSGGVCYNYDAEGNPTYNSEDCSVHNYSAANLLDNIDSDFGYNQNLAVIGQAFGYDGDNQLVKRTTTEREGNNQPTSDTIYYLRSSVLRGETITEINKFGQKMLTSVIANGAVVATQHQSQWNENVYWSHKDLSMSTVRSSNSSGQMITTADTGGDFDKLELDPQGNNVGFTDWWAIWSQGTPDPAPPPTLGNFDTIRNGEFVKRNVDGIDVPEEWFNRMLNFAYPSIFSLVEYNQRRSMREVGRWYRNFITTPAQPTPTPENPDPVVIGSQGSYLRSIVYDTSWSMNWTLIPEPFTQRPLTDEEKAKLQKNLKNFTADATCNKFITSILEKLKSTGRAGYETTDINKLLEMILGNTNNVFLSVNYLEVWEERRIKGESIGVASARTSFGGLSGNKRTTIRFDSYTFGFAQGNANGRPFIYNEINANIILVHELIHAFGNTEYFSHGDQAEAAFASAKAMGIDVKAAPKEADFIDKVTGKVNLEAFDSANSAYFGDVLKKACNGGR